MRTAAILFIVLALVANFYFNNLTSLVVAMVSFPVLLWVLLKKKKRLKSGDVSNAVSQPVLPEDHARNLPA